MPATVIRLCLLHVPVLNEAQRNSHSLLTDCQLPRLRYHFRHLLFGTALRTGAGRILSSIRLRLRLGTFRDDFLRRTLLVVNRAIAVAALLLSLRSAGTFLRPLLSRFQSLQIVIGSAGFSVANKFTSTTDHFPNLPALLSRLLIVRSVTATALLLGRRKRLSPLSIYRRLKHSLIHSKITGRII